MSTRHQMANSLPRTKDVLGDHLHYKVSESLKMYFRSYENMHDNCEFPADIITGMLLERSLKEINQMLTDHVFLLDNIHEALIYLICEKLSVNSSKEYWSQETLGEILYHRISKLDGKNASHLTGMLLEQDLSVLRKLLLDDNSLHLAIKKANESIIAFESSQLSNTHTVSNTGPSIKSQKYRHVDCSVCCQLDGDNYQESLGLHIFNEVVQIHPDINLAAKLTGMILDMDSASLHDVIADQQLIHLAIEKAYKALQSAS